MLHIDKHKVPFKNLPLDDKLLLRSGNFHLQEDVFESVEELLRNSDTNKTS